MACVIGAVFFGGCVAYKAPVMPPQGAIWTEFRAPLVFPKAGTRIGDLSDCKKHTKYICIPVYRPALSVAWDEMAIASAAREAGFKEVLYADYRLLSVLGTYAELELNLYGK